MTDLIVLAVLCVLSLATLLLRWRIDVPSKLVALAVTVLYCVTLLFALRFCAKNYPAAYVARLYASETPWMNDWVKGPWLFEVPGFYAAVVAGAASVLMVLFPASGGFRTLLSVVKWIAGAVAVAIIFYGLFWILFLAKPPV
ncbi:hypothetical protein [Sphingomonas sp.]|uniref:hypothetical protein n=1 Tax=Sphingomonas sp. TaxID=28214 RepID=UPI001B0F3B70|nr:hypothetical protein [Sphingomonas sp.]MBO9714291.1 hypothetical protein [Sphingomonas sp.]